MSIQGGFKPIIRVTRWDNDCLEFLPGGLSSYELTPLDVFQIKSDQCLFSTSKAESTPLDVVQLKSDECPFSHLKAELTPLGGFQIKSY